MYKFMLDYQVLSYGPINVSHTDPKEEMGRVSPEIQYYAADSIFQVRVMLTFIWYPHTHLVYLREALLTFFHDKSI